MDGIGKGEFQGLKNNSSLNIPMCKCHVIVTPLLHSFVHTVR